MEGNKDAAELTPEGCERRTRDSISARRLCSNQIKVPSISFCHSFSILPPALPFIPWMELGKGSWAAGSESGIKTNHCPLPPTCECQHREALPLPAPSQPALWGLQGETSIYSALHFRKQSVKMLD